MGYIITIQGTWLKTGGVAVTVAMRLKTGCVAVTVAMRCRGGIIWMTKPDSLTWLAFIWRATSIRGMPYLNVLQLGNSVQSKLEVWSE